MIPQYQTKGAVGFDLHSTGRYTILPGGITLIPTDIAVELPENYEIQIRPRSGIAYKNGITVLNTPGTIDEDFRNGIGVILVNHGKQNFTVQEGDRIAQGVVNKVEKAEWLEVEELSETERGGNGYGHTG